MNYDFNAIEEKWQKHWKDNGTFEAQNNSDKPKYYVLDMFPYPSGAGLHVGHPLGYIASDIYARYKRHQGFNVLHPQGYDSFGLPAEQYAIQTGQHPAITTETNIARYREQLDKIGFSFDWSREVRTSEPEYYRWTQWIFIQLFESWYNKDSNKAEHVDILIAKFEVEGNASVNAVCDENIEVFTAEEWKNASAIAKQEILLKYRLTYLAETEVNWCPALGTVLANDEIVNGVSERGGHPVVRKKMTQWSMRISAYAQRLLDGLQDIDWPQPLKDSQTNWIGRSKGASVEFRILPPTPSHGGGASHAGFMTGKPELISVLLERAQEMRDKPTKAEALLWSKLRGKKTGFKFRQQHPIDQYIVDFVCLSAQLIVEVDGDVHQYQMDKDAERQLLLEQKKGYKVLRFSNDEVLNNVEKVVETITSEIERREKVLTLGEDLGGERISVFTTRPDTIFGVTFMTLAPELDLVNEITTPEQKAEVDAYIAATAKRSERERMADVKTISGAFTGAYAEHPFTKEPIPIWIGDYVLAGYGTGAVMAVPCGDQRDWDFAKHFNIPIKNIFDGVDISDRAYAEKDNTPLKDSDFLNGLSYKQALPKAIEALEELEQGQGKINYRLRDAVFSRQRYWGEPFPTYYVDGMPQMIAAEHLPIRLPEVEKYLPTEEGEPPLGRADIWAWDTTENKVVGNEKIDHKTVFPLELNTMPGWAGSSWYFFRYMEKALRDEAFASKEAMDYWQNVDLYIGGSEHATGHLLYSRFWVKFLKDRGFASVEEPFKKLINQGMILGTSAFVYRVDGENKFVSSTNKNSFNVQPIHAPVEFVNASDELDVEAFKSWRPEFQDAEFILENGVYKVGREVEKMSKSKYNVVNPDTICEEYGADTLRMYEMFLGPLEQAKPWNTAGITGVHNFLKKLWKLYHKVDASGNLGDFVVSEESASKEAMKVLHKTIKKTQEDIENFSFNTSVSTFMIAVNELSTLKCNNRDVLEPLAILISPYAPHIAEELWSLLGHNKSIATAAFPEFDAKHLVESSKEYPISFNGKMRFTMELPLDLSNEEIEKAVRAHEKTEEYLGGREPKKVIIVPGKIINFVG
ncbi:leucine--tRNA ligase [Leeuwenhoekiella aequorea]|uniref:Leucine--tRNA ligase n=1 Tax=Leeuwenhoekiella aequorea TaxID=283736 RepID=A0A4Q0P6D9_9FLAO|nr:leucine--tRNA ligase [Leeuwenhoekiella aequorea]RXG22031.1 leucyl-tRNA synthetase [Leeuwenhoekiella aequorea]